MEVLLRLNKEEDMILSNMPLVKHIASKYYSSKAGIEYEDLVSYGVMGLIDASNKFDESRGVKFSTYASIRISSYIIDEIRKQSPISRGCVSKIKEYNRCLDILQNKHFREPTIDEICSYMKASKQEVNNIRITLANKNVTSLDEVLFDDENEIKRIDTIKEDCLSPSEIIENTEAIETVAKALNMLKEKDRLVLTLYYYEELTLKEIGKVLGVSESRISQINRKAISNLKKVMKELKYLD